jgi:hypothetical protein
MKNIKRHALIISRVVYKLLDSQGLILHVGETCQPNKRLRQHQLRGYPNAESLVVLEELMCNKNTAYMRQCEWQTRLGFTTDSERSAEILRNVISHEERVTAGKRVGASGLGGKAQPFAVKSANGKKGSAKTNAIQIQCDCGCGRCFNPGNYTNHMKWKKKDKV